MPSIDTFRGKLQGGGARANKFMVTMGFPAGLSGMPEDLSTTTSYLCSAATLPGMTIGEVTVPFRGRNLFIAGDRTFEAWTITILNDSNFHIRNGFEIWMNYINNMSNNEGVDNPSLYQTDAHVSQLGRDDLRVKTYSFRGMWPTTIGNIDLSYETNDAIETFDVTLRYNYWEATAKSGDPDEAASTTS